MPAHESRGLSPFTYVARFIRDFSDVDQLLKEAAELTTDGGWLETAFSRLAAAMVEVRTKEASFTGFDAAIAAPLIDVDQLRGVVHDPATRSLSKPEREIISATLTAAENLPSPLASPGYASPYQFRNLAVGMGTSSRVGQLVGLGLGYMSTMDRQDRKRWQLTGRAGDALRLMTASLFL